MKKIAVFFIFFNLFSFLRAEEITLTLPQAINIALRDNREILLKSAEVKEAKEKLGEARADLFPTLDVTVIQAKTRGYYIKDPTKTATQTTLKEYLYQGGKTINTIKQNKYKLEVSQALLDKKKLEVVLEVKKTFYTLLLAEEFSKLNKNIVENTNKHLEFIRERYKIGQASESEILKIEATLASLQQAYEASLNQVESGQILLNSLLYLDKDIRIKPDAQFRYEPIEVAYDEAFLQAMQARPEIRQYEAQTQADKKAIEIAKADNRPEIYASWDYYSSSRNAANAKNWNDYNVIGLTFSWPIFDGWATRHKVEQALLDLKETQLNKEKAIRDIAVELKDAYLSLKNAIAKLKASEMELILYKDNFLTVEEKYKEGQMSLLDKDDADLKYQVSDFNRNQAVYDYLFAKSNFDKATGGL